MVVLASTKPTKLSAILELIDLWNFVLSKKPRGHSIASIVRPRAYTVLGSIRGWAKGECRQASFSRCWWFGKSDNERWNR